MQPKIQIGQYINSLPCNDVRRKFTTKLKEVMKEEYPTHMPWDFLAKDTLDGILQSVK